MVESMIPIESGSAGIFLELHATVIAVSDLSASCAWYEDVLGLEPRRVIEGVLAVYGTGGPTNICLYVPQPGQERPGYQDGGAFPNWRSRDAAATHAHLTERGVRCTDVQSSPEIAWFTFYDPDGNRLDVCEYGPDWLE
jgi:catechol 2,3-dioxygenase-like lactoylglutathione lyase family enzyme